MRRRGINVAVPVCGKVMQRKEEGVGGNKAAGQRCKVRCEGIVWKWILLRHMCLSENTSC